MKGLETGRLVSGLVALGIPNAEETAFSMRTFMRLVLERNEVINLTTVTDEDEFIDKHLLDSVRCYGWSEIEAAEYVVDVGTGAGFPGVPLALIYPRKNFLLLDSLGKRTAFLEDAVAALNLENVSVLHSRAEDAGRDAKLRERFDLCVSRAVDKLSVLSEYCFPFLKSGGFLYAYKTLKAAGEIDDSRLARQLLGGAPDAEIRDAALAPVENSGCASARRNAGHSIIVLKKAGPTPSTYPRKAGTPKKVPL
ncbi:MAG: 16S rRNA (guanine(527)-N(7))-methyltransferase RsmG [Clostridiales Family XIII bacterium]|jgi:16S rRNA (guanine527-N7)-methyltransferase|nr:16S rRNA (guanine(527)-N(7))-methyltransferase RsmG [Clostridiales Family XIII bacterium]